MAGVDTKLKGFKVVRVTEDGHYESYNINYAIKYGVKEPTRPKGFNGPLSLFGSYEDAQRFIIQEEQVRSALDMLPHRVAIFVCEYKPSEAEFLWSYGPTRKNRRYALPVGTILADEITLTRLLGS